MVLGTALAIKMIAYVGVAPVAAAFAERLPRRTMLVTLDLVRAGVALVLPFVSQIWEVYVLIFVLQSASAVFTPTFQATIPDVLLLEDDYTKALSLSRLAYDMESLVSPMLAAALLTVIGFQRRSKREAFIAAAQLKFGSQFDYSKVEYVNQKHSVEIGCERHSSFMQTPDKYLQATFGCPACGVDSRATLTKEIRPLRLTQDSELNHVRVDCNAEPEGTLGEGLSNQAGRYSQLVSGTCNPVA